MSAPAEDLTRPRPSLASRFWGGSHPGYSVSITLLFVATLLSNADRQVLGLLLEPIKRDLHFSDTQLGLLSGLTFAVFYALFGLPFARWADVGNRRTIMGVCFAAWSVMTALCGMASNFTQMFLARIGVGVGEAGGNPTSHGLVAAYWPAERSASGAAALAIAGNIGFMVGFGLGGIWAEHFGWRSVFFLFGIPGAIFAILVMLFMKEPRQAPRLPTVSEVIGPKSLAVMWSLVKRPSFAHLVVGYTIFFIISAGAGQFFAPFMMRSFHMTISQVGIILSLMATIPLVIGTFIGGWLSNLLVKRSRKWLVWAPAACFGLNTVFYTAGVLQHDWRAFVACAMVSMLLVGISGPAIYAALYGVVGVKQRATGIAIMGFFVNLIGTGFGPLWIGMLSDYLAPTLFAESLRYALLSLGLIKIWSVIHFLLAAKHLEHDMDHADDEAVPA
jgi:MFS family permease